MGAGAAHANVLENWPIFLRNFDLIVIFGGEGRRKQIFMIGFLSINSIHKVLYQLLLVKMLNDNSGR